MLLQLLLEVRQEIEEFLQEGRVSVKKAAPMRKDSGTTTRLEAPTTRRTAWGTIMPTKAIRPLTATAEADAREAAAITIQRTR